MSWADDYRTMKVRANADNPRDAKQAIEFGAEASAYAGQSTCSLRKIGCHWCKS